VDYPALTSEFSGHFEFYPDGSVEVAMPSNIALIKYMGKTDADKNLPTNGSYSLTLPHLLTKVKCQRNTGSLDQWKPLLRGDVLPLELTPDGQGRFLEFWNFLKAEWGIEGYYLIQSGNTFPSDCGIASSGSSFAALTIAAYLVAIKQNSSKVRDLTLSDLANFSRQGSGSSCRSFFKGGAYWKDKEVKSVTLPAFKKAYHLVALVESGKKEVSSSEAHKRVTSSLLFKGRVERAEIRLKQLLTEPLSWWKMYQICWAEFWDMQALFETSEPSFGYMTSKTFIVLNLARDFWRQYQEGPVVTMDAGANVHLLFNQNQTSLFEEFKNQLNPLNITWYEGVL
jgi:diphosphomevalonate decarboxylase